MLKPKILTGASIVVGIAVVLALLSMSDSIDQSLWGFLKSFDLFGILDYSFPLILKN